MARSLDLICPICGRDSWITILRMPDLDLEQCSKGCIVRTIPPPRYSPDLPEGASAEKVLSDPDPGHFSIPKQILDLISPIQPSGRLLDVGSGWGHLLKLAAERGYDAVGLEASPGAAAISREAFGVNIIEGTFPDHQFEPCEFDIVVTNHVLEHLEDPVAALQEAYRILKPAGIIAVCVPNYDSLMSMRRAERWQGLQPSQHVWQFSASSVDALLQQAGFTIISVRYGRLSYPRAARSFAKWLGLCISLWVADLLNMGDNLVMLARKPFGLPAGECR